MSILQRIFFFLFIIILTTQVKAQFKVVGYIRATGDIVSDLQKVDLGKVTHLNIAFINPDTTGIFRAFPALDTVVSMAHARKVKVLMSCGGGSRHVYYAKLLSDAWRQTVVDRFIAFVDRYQLDGIDVDIEGDDIDSNYENFVVALKAPLRSRGKLLTAALAYYTRNRISDKALQQFDFINMMAYDKTGPWRLTDPTQHAPVSYAVDHLDYWSHERKVPKEELVVGLPFYGYGFGPLPDTNNIFRSMSYRDIVARFPGAEKHDEMHFPGNGGTIYYNGKPTIRDKTALALQRGGGVMIWHLLGDSTGTYSLLNVIHETVDKNK